MEIKELRYFKAIAELSSFSKAAVQLRIAQPALSRQMQKLERDLGTDIFLRQGRTISLTAAGRVLLGEVDQILRQLELTRLAVVGTTSQRPGTCRSASPRPPAGCWCRGCWSAIASAVRQ